MPTYLAAFVCDYGHISRIERGKEVSEGRLQVRDVGAGSGPFRALLRPQGLGLHPHGPLLVLPRALSLLWAKLCERERSPSRWALWQFHVEVAPHVP